MSFSSDTIKRMLTQVGFSDRPGELEVAPGVVVETFSSDYARLYVVECVNFRSRDWADIVMNVDRAILQDIRSAELATGGVVDAHACFVVSSEEQPLEWAQANERLVRNISRKYWISASDIDAEFVNRLTILPIKSPPPMGASKKLSLSPDESAWVGELVSEGVSSQYSSFVSRLKSSR